MMSPVLSPTTSFLTSLLLIFLSIYKINAFVVPSRHVLDYPSTSITVQRRSQCEREGSAGSAGSVGSTSFRCALFVAPSRLCEDKEDEEGDALGWNNNDKSSNGITSRYLFLKKSLFSTSTAVVLTALSVLPQEAVSKCTDIESCREIGERKVEQDMIDNPTIRLESGARYKVLQPGIDGGVSDNTNTVQADSNIDMIFSISTLSGGYMYSRGFGFEKVDIGDNKLQSDAGLDSLRVQLGQRDVPLGIEDALIGMKKGERRRVELPPRVGFETSQWKPEPTTKRGKARIVGYRQLIEGNGSTRPPFPAATIWDIEVLRIRK